jgi:hypothetical protein
MNLYFREIFDFGMFSDYHESQDAKTLLSERKLFENILNEIYYRSHFDFSFFHQLYIITLFTGQQDWFLSSGSE